jgi:lycopene beta-cyclase
VLIQVSVSYDYALVGGGLQNGLVALALRARQPHARVALIERGSIGGNHTWCFHAGDVPAEATWVDPLVAARWDGYDVAFPAYRRTLDSPYACVTSARLAACVGDDVLHGEAVEVAADHVLLADGRRIDATCVIDARGPDRASVTACGWQKFVGLELEVAHAIERPMLMDATVPQRDGFRFLYVLPLAPDRLLVEDTYFSDTPDLDVAQLRGEIAARMPGARVVREETGVLPLPWQHAAPSAASPLVAGYAGGWFHPVTGYSFPIAVRLAELVASLAPDALFGPELAALARDIRRQQRFTRRLNKMLFRWFAPEHRYGVLERFYRLPEPRIRRFYALQTTALDRTRILVGRPPRGMTLRRRAA